MTDIIMDSLKDERYGWHYHYRKFEGEYAKLCRNTVLTLIATKKTTRYTILKLAQVCFNEKIPVMC